MATSRRAYRIDENHPGSDVAAETAAAMAAASMVFRTTNPHYAHLLLDHAQQVHVFIVNDRSSCRVLIRIGTSYHMPTHPKTTIIDLCMYGFVSILDVKFVGLFVLQLFEFGDKFRGKYDDSVGAAKGYYPSLSGYKDELLWGALWLYKATDNDYYLNYTIQNAQSFGGTTWAMTEFSWDVKHAGLQLLAATVTQTYSQFHDR